MRNNDTRNSRIIFFISPHNFPREKHQFLERNKPVVTSRIIPGFLAEKREAGVHIPKIFNPGLGVTFTEQLFDFLTIGKVEMVHCGVIGLVGVWQCAYFVDFKVWYKILHLRFLQSTYCRGLFPTQSTGNIHCDLGKISEHFTADLYKLLFLTKHPFHMAHTTSNPKIHEGRNLKRFREMMAVKQDALAFELGEDWNQQKISLLEQKEKIDSDILEQVAAILKIPAEAIRNFDEDQAITVISSTFNHNAAVVNNNPVFHPIEKLIQLHEEKIALYERMLTEKDEMMERLERLVMK